MLQALSLVAWLAVAAGEAVPSDGPRLLLVLPVLDPSPPELSLPGVDLWAESLMLELGGAPLRVEALRPAGLEDPAAIEREAQKRGVELGAAAVLWARLVPPAAGCPAPRALRLVLLDPVSGESVQRDLCPLLAGVPPGPEELSRAMALAALHALQAGELPGLVLPAPSPRPIAVAPTPSCPDPPSCPACPPAACPPAACPAPPGTDRGVLRLRVTAAYSSQPTWTSTTLGPEVALAWAPLDWLEVGVGLAVFQGRRIEVDQVEALYGTVPLKAWVGGFWGGEDWQLGIDLGVQASYTRLDALLPVMGTTAVINRWNPALLGRALARWWTPWNFAIQLQIGADVNLRHQRYVYHRGEFEATVLSMQTASFEAGLGLVIPLLPRD